MPATSAQVLNTFARRSAYHNLEDGRLLARFASGDEPAAFDEIVRRHGPLVLGVCRRACGHSQDAEDAFQATFLALSRGAKSIRKGGALASWLYGTAVRVSRKASRRQSAPTSARTSTSDPFADAVWKEIRTLLDDELCKLSEAYRAPLVLCYLEGRTRDEAAAALGLSRRTLMRRLDVGRERLRIRLERRGLAAVGLGIAVLSPGALAATVPVELVRKTIEATSFASATVAALLGSATPLRAVFAGLCLAVAAGGGAGWTWPATRSTDPPAVQEKPSSNLTETAMTDADGRPLPPGAIARLGSRKFRIEGRNRFILPTPDGKFILVAPEPSLSAYATLGLFLLDAETGLRVRKFEDGHRVPKVNTSESIRPVAFNTDGTKLYGIASTKNPKDFDVWGQPDSSAERVLLVWDVATGKKTAEWPLPPGNQGAHNRNNVTGTSYLGVAISPDGKQLWVSGSIRMRVDAQGRVHGMPGVHVLDAATGTKLQTWDDTGYPIDTLASGKEVLTIRLGMPISAVDVATGRVVRTFPLDVGYETSAVVSPDGKVVAAVTTASPKKENGEVCLWEAATATEIRRWSVPRSSWIRLVFSPDGKTLYLSTNEGRIKRWNVAEGKELPGWLAHPESSRMIADMVFRPKTNELFSVGYGDGRLKRWDAATGKLLSVTTAYAGEVATVRTPDGKGVVVVDETGRLDVWDLVTGRVSRTIQTPGRKNHIPVFTPDGKRLLLAADTGPISIWSWPEGNQVGTIEPPPKKDSKHDDSYWATLRFSPDGQRLFASKFGRGGWVWTWPEREVLWHEADVPESTFLPDNKTIVTTEWHAPIRYRDLDTGKVRKELKDVKAEGVGDGTLDVAISRDGRRMVTGHFDKSFKVRDAGTGAILKSVPCPGFVWSLAFSPSGWLLAVAADQSVIVFDTASWDEVARFDGHDGTVKTVFFGPDDWTLVSGSPEDGTALVWSLKPATAVPPDANRLLADLAGDGKAVRRAVAAAAAHPDAAVKLFKERWPIPKPVDAERVRKLIEELDSPVFADRETASSELAKLGRPVEDAVRAASAMSPSAEVRKRAGLLLEGWAPATQAGERPEGARERRAVWALELAGTTEAKALLAAWAEAKVGNRLCEEAAAAIRRGKSSPDAGREP